MLSLNKRLNEIGDKQTSDKAKIQEEINITAIVDVSGSVNNEELNDFTNEIINIAKSFNNVKITAVTPFS